MEGQEAQILTSLHLGLVCSSFALCWCDQLPHVVFPSGITIHLLNHIADCPMRHDVAMTWTSIDLDELHLALIWPKRGREGEPLLSPTPPKWPHSDRLR